MQGRYASVAALVVAMAFLAGCVKDSASGNSPTSTREPKNLAERLTINMGDEDPAFYFSEPGGSRGGPFRLSSGKVVGIHLVNVGDEEHELVVGRGVKYVAGDSGQVPDGFNESFFESLPADVFVYGPQKVEVATDGGIGELEAEAGGALWIRATLPDSMRGTWEIGCFKPGHYEGGMKATLLVT